MPSRAHLDREIVQVFLGACEQGCIGAWGQAREQGSIGALAVQADDAIGRTHYDAHARSIAGEVQHIQHLMHALRRTQSRVSSAHLPRSSIRLPSSCRSYVTSSCFFFMLGACTHSRRKTNEVKKAPDGSVECGNINITAMWPIGRSSVEQGRPQQHMT